MKTKNILICGCEGKVGKSVARLFQSRGWHTAGMDLAAESADSHVDTYISCDVKNAEAVEKAVAELESSRPVNAVFNAAGIELKTGLEDTPISQWNHLLETMLGGSANICKAAAPYMIKRKSGKLLLLSADYAKAPGDCVLNGTAAGTLHGFAKSLGVELAPYHVLVNAVFAGVPFDLESIAETVYFLADKDSYTAAQVISICGKQGDGRGLK